VPRSITGWFIVCWSAFLLASIVVGVLLLSLYRQTTTEQVRRASAAVAHGSRSLVEEQVTNGVAVRMALLYLTRRGGR